MMCFWLFLSFGYVEEVPGVEFAEEVDALEEKRPLTRDVVWMADFEVRCRPGGDLFYNRLI